MSDVRWVILRSRYPLGMPTEELGELTAPDKATAEQRGTALYGPPVVAQSVASRAISQRERLGGGRMPRRAPKPMPAPDYGYKNRLAAFNAQKRAQAKRGPDDAAPRDHLPQLELPETP